MITEVTAHVNGVNWESVTTTAASVIIIVGAIVGWFTRQITHAINDLSNTLMLRLETKEVVNAINIRLTSVETTLRDIHLKGTE